MASLDIFCSNPPNLKNKIRKIEHEKIFCGPSKILKNISWPINIRLTYFMTYIKTFQMKWNWGKWNSKYGRIQQKWDLDFFWWFLVTEFHLYCGFRSFLNYQDINRTLGRIKRYLKKRNIERNFFRQHVVNILPLLIIYFFF